MKDALHIQDSERWIIQAIGGSCRQQREEVTAPLICVVTMFTAATAARQAADARPP